MRSAWERGRRSTFASDATEVLRPPVLCDDGTGGTTELHGGTPVSFRLHFSVARARASSGYVFLSFIGKSEGRPRAQRSKQRYEEPEDCGDARL